MEKELKETIQQKAGHEIASLSLLKKLLTGALKEKGYIYDQAVGEGGFGVNYSVIKGGKKVCT